MPSGKGPTQSVADMSVFDKIIWFLFPVMGFSLLAFILFMLFAEMSNSNQDKINATPTFVR